MLVSGIEGVGTVPAREKGCRTAKEARWRRPEMLSDSMGSYLYTASRRHTPTSLAWVSTLYKHILQSDISCLPNRNAYHAMLFPTSLPPLLDVLLALCIPLSVYIDTHHSPSRTYLQHSSSSSALPSLCSSQSASAPIGPPRSHQTSRSLDIAT